MLWIQLSLRFQQCTCIWEFTSRPLFHAPFLSFFCSHSCLFLLLLFSVGKEMGGYYCHFLEFSRRFQVVFIITSMLFLSCWNLGCFSAFRNIALFKERKSHIAAQYLTNPADLYTDNRLWKQDIPHLFHFDYFYCEATWKCFFNKSLDFFFSILYCFTKEGNI